MFNCVGTQYLKSGARFEMKHNFWFMALNFHIPTQSQILKQFTQICTERCKDNFTLGFLSEENNFITNNTIFHIIMESVQPHLIK